VTSRILLLAISILFWNVLPVEAANQSLQVQPVKASNGQKCTEFYTINNQFYCANKAVASKPSLQAALANESNKFSFDGREWKLDWWNQNAKQPMLEYVLKSETVDNWTEMVTSQFFPGLQSKFSPSQFMSITIEELTKRGFQPKVRIISQSPQSVLFEWQIVNHPVENQYELQKIVAEPHGLHLIHYASRPTVTQERRTAWEKILSQATPKL
jgi:hypothetical protein